MQSKRPFLSFIFLCFAFLVAQSLFKSFLLHYNWVHFYFGLCFPLILGYFPILLFRWNGLRKLPINYSWHFNWQWSIRAGVIGTFLVSFINEVINDPEQNRVPFLKAWHHFAFDMAGILLFVAFYYILIKLSTITGK